MGRLAEWWRRLRGHADKERRLDDEIAFHIDQQTAKNIGNGMAPDEARRAALLRFGGVEPLKEQTRDEFRPALLQDFWRDVRVGARTLRRAPGFAAIAILTIGLGTGAATAVFTVVNGVLLKPLPYPQSERLVRLLQINERGRRQSNVSEMNFADWQARTRTFAGMAKMGDWGPVPVSGAVEPTMARATIASREFFEVMRVQPQFGRSFAPPEQKLGGIPAAVISHMFWQRSLGSTPDFGAKGLRIGDRVYVVVGVMPPGFDYPNGTAVWLARELNAPDQSRTAHNFQIIGRVRDDVEVSTAHADISAVSRELKVRYGNETWMFDAAAVPLLEQLTTTSTSTLQLLFGAALLLLIVANTNISSLLLARATARQSQFAIQLAIGAGRARIARQLFAEAAVLCALGGIVGIIASVWLVSALVGLGPANTPRLDQVSVDWTALAFAVGVSMVSALTLALVTTIGARDVRLASVLGESQRTGAGGRRSLFARQTLVVAQVALTLLLLAGSGLLARSFVNLLAVDPGYRLDDALVVDLTLAAGSTDFRARRVGLLDGLLERVRSLPGVSSAGVISGFPLGGGNYSNGRFLEMTSPVEFSSRDEIAKLSEATVAARAGQAEYRIASADYFKTMGIPLIRGRVFTESDGPDAPHVAVISQSLADAKWPNQDPIGRFVQFGNMDGDRTGFRIVGIVGDVRELTPEALPRPMFYGSYRQRPNSVWRISVVIRGQDPDLLAPSVRRVVRELDPELPVQTRTIQSAFDTALAGRRFSLVLITMFGASALVLATLGLYGVIAYLVAQRTREIGIRIALGAKSVDVVRLIVVRGLVLAGIGCVAGLVAAVSLGGLVQSLLYTITPTDPAVLGTVVVVTILSAIAACYLPARRATRIDPVNSLRSM